MNQTVDIANQLLSNPPPELGKLVDDPRTSSEARTALTEATASSSNLRPQPHVNGDASSSNTGNKLDDGRLQIVDEHQNFTKTLSTQLAEWGMLDKGFAYDIVAVFGSQSTGKSTLLNGLFGTSFPVMDEAKRQQTTKGIWMCPSKYSSTLVMDVEGTDGRERGEDQDFQRKSALFSLASTEVLIANIWEHQIGLYQGANIALLKTVFEVNLGLFGGSNEGSKPKLQEKTLILFVIRDHVGSTPMSNLTSTLTQDMHVLWASLSKPPHLADAKLEEYFDLSFTALPHKLLMPEKFNEDVLELRKRFIDRSRSDYVFQPAYHKRIPADGISFYMEGIWQQVLTNKDLDLPTQQELLAQFRCDEIATVALETFNTSAKVVRKPVEAGSVIQGLGSMMRDWSEVALGKFDRDASRYHNEVYTRKRADLVASLHSILSPLFSGQLKNLHRTAAAQFSKDISLSLKEANYDFADAVEKATSTAKSGFLGGAKEALLQDTDWSYEPELDSLSADLKAIGDGLRKDETKKLLNATERQIKRHLLEPVEVAMTRPKPDLWDEVATTYGKVLDDAEKSYLDKAHHYDCTSEENQAAQQILQARAWLVLRRKLEEQTSDATILNTLRTTFEDRFRYDEQGLPRVWKPEDDIETAFTKAKDETLNLLPLLSSFKPSDPKLLPPLPEPEASYDADADPVPFDPSTAYILISPTKLVSLESRFKRDADAAYVEAKRSMVSSVAQIPMWMYGVLVALGWNEAMAVLFNPLYFAMLLVLAATGYIIIQLGLAGPMLQLAKTLLNEIRRIATDKLREAFAEVPEAQRVLNSVAPGNETSADTSTDDNPRRRGDLLGEKMMVK